MGGKGEVMFEKVRKRRRYFQKKKLVRMFFLLRKQLKQPRVPMLVDSFLSSTLHG